ncbi:MAG: NAD-dependent epimerase/dehydratase family protein [Actinomycetota bacterium]|nr:NAD-dependent epimerase/dehydratase family protein [Actinomycetota bacterium]
MITWVIGAGGLLGSAVVRALDLTYQPGPVPWRDPDLAIATLQAQTAEFARQAGTAPWAIVWAAGQATTSSTAEETARELTVFSAFIEAVRAELPPDSGTVFITSSAGGVYGGSSSPPFDASTDPRPLGAYGMLKLDQERLAIERLGASCQVIIGRLSNLYGPGQDLTKLQGLISRLALASVTRVPITMFVSLDTLRDYLYVDDAAAMICMWLNRSAELDGQPLTVVIAAGQSVSLGHVISTMQDVTRTRIPIAYGAHASASAQSRDLRLIPTDAQSTRPLVRMPLVAGAKRVHLDVLERQQRHAD